MHNRQLRPRNEDKDFTDKLGPLKRWIAVQVGRNWDKVYSEIRSVFPNTNKQNHHMLETHLLHEVERSVTVDKSERPAGVRRPILASASYVSASCILTRPRICLAP